MQINSMLLPLYNKTFLG